MADNEHANVGADVPIEDQIRKTRERKGTPFSACRSTNLRELFEQRDDALKLSQEAASDPTTGLALIEPESLGQVSLSSPM